MVTKTVSPRGSGTVEPDDAATVLICLLGQFRLLCHGRPLDLAMTGKAATLLATLALHRHSGVSREALLDTIWPEQDWTQATVSLNSLVYSVHRRLRTGAHTGTAVIYANGSYYLNTAAGYSTDVARFDALVAGGNLLAAAGWDLDAASHFERAVDLYRGDLSLGTDIHSVLERERLRASFLTILAWLADRAYREADYAVSLAHALRLLDGDPCREDAHRLIMRAHVRRGERAQALRQYRVCERLLRREFDAVPEALTTELFDRIRLEPASV